MLYGGSVSTGNAEAILHLQHVDGLFVGRAAWSAAGFRELLRLAARTSQRASVPERRRGTHDLRVQ